MEVQISVVVNWGFPPSSWSIDTPCVTRDSGNYFFSPCCLVDMMLLTPGWQDVCSGLSPSGDRLGLSQGRREITTRLSLAPHFPVWTWCRVSLCVARQTSGWRIDSIEFPVAPAANRHKPV